MTNFRALLAPAAALTLLVPSVAAQSGSMNGPLGGEWLLGLDLAYTHREQDDVESESAMIGASLSYFLSRPHQWGIELRSRFDAIEAGGHAGELFAGALYNYNWYLAERTGLYAGLRAGAAYEDATGTADGTHFAWGGQIGLRQWITPRAALYVEPRFTRYEIDDANATERERFDLLIGLNLVL